MTDTTTTPQKLRAQEIEDLDTALHALEEAVWVRYFGDEYAAYDQTQIALEAIARAKRCALEANALDADAALPAASPITQTPTEGDTQ